MTLEEFYNLFESKRVKLTDSVRDTYLDGYNDAVEVALDVITPISKELKTLRKCYEHALIELECLDMEVDYENYRRAEDWDYRIREEARED